MVSRLFSAPEGGTPPDPRQNPQGLWQSPLSSGPACRELSRARALPSFTVLPETAVLRRGLSDSPPVVPHPEGPPTCRGLDFLQAQPHFLVFTKMGACTCSEAVTLCSSAFCEGSAPCLHGDPRDARCVATSTPWPVPGGSWGLEGGACQHCRPTTRVHVCGQTPESSRGIFPHQFCIKWCLCDVGSGMPQEESWLQILTLGGQSLRYAGRRAVRASVMRELAWGAVWGRRGCLGAGILVLLISAQGPLVPAGWVPTSPVDPVQI